MGPNRTPRRAVSAGLLALLAAPAAWGQGPTPAEEQPATLTVRLPRDDARLTVDGAPTKQAGKVRRFQTPPLPAGRRFAYTLVALIEPNNYTKITRTRKVVVQGGQETEVDMTKADPAQPDGIVIRWVPTPPDIVEAMLKMGKVGKGDVVYDLGCGDGRIVIAAVKDFGAKRGVGVDLDPEKIEKSRAAAKRAGVDDRVEFRQADVLKVKDIGEANVVMLYMANDLNEALRPTLQKELKPGSRIVSHRFLMGDWKPDRTETLTGRDGDTYQIHLWTIREK